MSHNIEPNSTDVDTSSTQEKEIWIKSVSEFIEKITQLNKVEEKENTETFYYRGHADRTWGLLPSILRRSNEESSGVEKEHLLFRDMVAHIPQSFSECKSALDYLVQMQHYELPTRLLDVTTNPLVALYFACEQQVDNDNYATMGAFAGLTKGFETVKGIIERIPSLFREGSSDWKSVVSQSVRSILVKIHEIRTANQGADARTIAESIAQDYTDIDAKAKAIFAVVIITQVKGKKVTPIYSLPSAIAGSLAGAGAISIAKEVAILLTDAQLIPRIQAEPDIKLGNILNNYLVENIEEELNVQGIDDFIIEVFIKLAIVLFVEDAIEAAQKERSKDGAIYLFSIPKGKVKHYDSDTVSVLANLAKCSDQEIDICTEQIKDERKCEVLEEFNKQDGTRILLRQIKEEKPYFEPLIRPEDLSSIFLVKPKYGNPRIINQAGAFFIFGLGSGCGGHLTKGGDVEIPSDWIRHKFIVPKKKKKQILEELAQLGITESYIYPEIDKYAKELKKRYKL